MKPKLDNWNLEHLENLAIYYDIQLDNLSGTGLIEEPLKKDSNFAFRIYKGKLMSERWERENPLQSACSREEYLSKSYKQICKEIRNRRSQQYFF